MLRGVIGVCGSELAALDSSRACNCCCMIITWFGGAPRARAAAKFVSDELDDPVVDVVDGTLCKDPFEPAEPEEPENRRCCEACVAAGLHPGSPPCRA